MKNGGAEFNLKWAMRALTESIESSPHPRRVMRTLCREFGPRPPASDEMKRAQEFLRREWLAIGAREVHREPVTYRAWLEGRAEVNVTGPARCSMDGIQAIHSAPGTVEAPLVDGGRLRFEDLQRLGDAAHDAIVLVDGNVPTGGQFEPIQKRISLAEASGVAGVLIAGTYPNLPSITFLSRARIPVVSISAEDARKLRRWLPRRRVRVRLRATGRTRNVTCHNLIADFGPSRRDVERLVACAHMDTFYLSPAAMDNTSGVVTMTEVARALAPFQDRFVRGLRVIAFTGEEYGYAGSKHYVRAHANELDHIRFILSMDCMFESTAEGVAVMGAPKLRDYIERGLRRSHPRVDVRDKFCMSSDYLPFMLAGVAAARPADWRNSFPAHPHTTMDTDEKVPVRWLKANAAMCASILLRMLTDPKPLPAVRKTPDEVARMVREADAEDLLRWQVQLPS